VAPLARTLVVDHFGRPNAQKGGLKSPEFEALLRAGEGRDWYVKVSAPYRCPGIDVEQAWHLFRLRWGIERLLWGSDWPWTQHETLIDYVQWCEPFDGEGRLPVLLEANAMRVFGAPAD